MTLKGFSRILLATFKLDLTFKPESRRFKMEEVAVYRVKDGKVAYEEFFYKAG